MLCFSSLSTQYIKSSKDLANVCIMCLADEVMNIGDMMCARKYDLGRAANFFISPESAGEFGIVQYSNFWQLSLCFRQISF